MKFVWRWLGSGFPLLIALRCILFGSGVQLLIALCGSCLVAAFRFLISLLLTFVWCWFGSGFQLFDVVCLYYVLFLDFVF